MNKHPDVRDLYELLPYAGEHDGGGPLDEAPFEPADVQSDSGSEVEEMLNPTDNVMEFCNRLDEEGKLDVVHVMQYLNWGNHDTTEAESKLLQFMRAMFCGNGASIRTAQETLNFIHTIEGSSILLPKTLQLCWKSITNAHADLTRPTTMKVATYPVPPEIQALMTSPRDVITMQFLDPTEALVRLLVCSPLAADRRNVVFFPESSDVLDDWCHGARWHRIQETLAPGVAALTCSLFFDEINMDKKGFQTGEGAIIVAGFFRRQPRESTYAKLSLGTFSSVAFPKVLMQQIFM